MLVECYERHTSQYPNGDEKVVYRKVEAGLTDVVYEDFTILETMPENWQPSSEDPFIHELPGRENVVDLMGYARNIFSSTENGVTTYRTEYYRGLINRTVTEVFTIEALEFMPDEWEPIPGIHKILYEDVLDPTVYE
ncbi:hypothetical protein [Nostoc phage YongM]|nr:hypothetical protein [Nostoc phage YongM]